MTFLVVLGLYFAALFLLFFFSRRHIGMPALGLTAGAVLAKLWTDGLTPVVAQAGFVIESPPLHSVVAVVLTILPALIVMTRATKAHSFMHQAYSSIVFAALAVMLTWGAFANAVILDDTSRGIVLELLPYDSVVITACILLALLDVVYHRKQPLATKKK
ncbi:MAG TPA: hypothetical protein VL362_03135 [Patescibacteria group bacterium]|jgi:hypothetical protein|nr:hypothetical protein [Patescibacteria group bacterium]